MNGGPIARPAAPLQGDVSTASDDQPTLDEYAKALAERARDTGEARASGSLDGQLWLDRAADVLDRLIDEGRPFTVDDVIVECGPSPAAGGLIRAATVAGRIARVDFVPSRRIQAHGRYVSLWRAA